MADIDMACIVSAYMVMACAVMAYIVMARGTVRRLSAEGGRWWQRALLADRRLRRGERPGARDGRRALQIPAVRRP